MNTDRMATADEYRAPFFAGTTPPQETVCAECPASLWYEAGNTESASPFAFCTVMKMTTWPRPAGPITRCDGQRVAVAKFAAEMRRSGPSGQRS